MAMQDYRSSGKAEVLGQSVESISLTKHGKVLGMCPQYNSIFEQLTVTENLYFMGRIKGLSSGDIEKNSEIILKTLELEEFRHVVSDKLSGGNKRKLSCALTLMLCPKVLYMDEPTTGVDPVSRRSLFKMIKSIKNHSG